MTILNPFHVRLDGLTVATYAHGLEDISGIDTVVAPSRRGVSAAYNDGTIPRSAPYIFGPKRTAWRMWVAPVDADGAVTLAGGLADHLRVNMEALQKVLGKTRSGITVEYDVPDGAGGTRTLRNIGRLAQDLAPAGTHKTRRVPVGLTFDWPFWDDTTTGLVTKGPYTGAQTLTPAGTAPLVDAKLTCTVAGRITHDETGEYVEVTSIPGGASSVIVTLRPPRTVKDNTGADVGNVLDVSHPWGLRFEAGVAANLTITGTWQLDYFEAYA